MRKNEYSNVDFLKKYKNTPFLHKYVVFPAILKQFEAFEGEKVLDIGCGFGDLAHLLSLKKADVKGIDASEQWAEFWKSEYSDTNNLTLRVGDATDILRIFPDEKFDYVIMNMVLLNMPNVKIIERTFNCINSILKLNGKFIFSDIHPIALMESYTTAEIQTRSPGFSYFKDGSIFTSKVLLNDKTWIEIEDFHWTLETYTDLLQKTNMYISKIIEPEPIEDSPAILEKYEVPEHIIFVCRKLQ